MKSARYYMNKIETATDFESVVDEIRTESKKEVLIELKNYVTQKAYLGNIGLLIIERINKMMNNGL